MREGPEHYIEGKLGDIQLVSIPETTSHAMASQLKTSLEEALGVVVLIVTHNTQFMQVRKMTPSDSSKVVKEVEDIREERAVQLLGPDFQPIN